MKVWIVLPAYNEEESLPVLLDSLIKELEYLQKPFSILVVNDGSKDKTGAIIDDYASRAPVIPIHHPQNRGLSQTLRTGFFEVVQRSRPEDVVITMDADNTQPATLVRRMVDLVASGKDVVIASRYRRGSRVMGVPFHRQVLSIGSAVLFRLLFPISGVRDYTCGYRAYRAKVLHDLIREKGRDFTEERGFSCMVDVLLVIRNSNLTFTEVPMVLRYDLKPGETKMKVASTTLDTLKLLLRKRFA